MNDKTTYEEQLDKFGKPSEKDFIKRLAELPERHELYDPKAVRVNGKKNKYADIMSPRQLFFPREKTFYEVKEQNRAKFNVFVPISKIVGKNKYPYDLSITRADYWVFYTNNSVYVMPTYLLKKICRGKEVQVNKNTGNRGYDYEGYLVVFSELESISEYIFEQ